MNSVANTLPENTDAIIRVKSGRMRNQWHHKGLAEYMTKQRFSELGLTEAAIGVRDRSFGKQLVVDEAQDGQNMVVQEPQTAKRKEVVTMAVSSRLSRTSFCLEVLGFCFRDTC